MPTYTYRCDTCHAGAEVFRTLSDYLSNPCPLFCCAQPMARHITVAPGLATHNPLAGDRHYEGMRAPDGADISTRTKHRAYMKEHGLTTADDYRGEWAQAAKARAAWTAGDDPTRRADIERTIAQLDKP